MNGTFPMTQEGYDLLKQELKHLTTVERPDVINAIAEARAHGDLSENAEYHAAKERQGYIEGRIQELNVKLASANVIVSPNCRVTRLCLEPRFRSWM